MKAPELKDLPQEQQEDIKQSLSTLKTRLAKLPLHSSEEEATKAALLKYQSLLQKKSGSNNALEHMMGVREVPFLLPEELYSQLSALMEQGVEVNELVVDAIEGAVKAVQAAIHKSQKKDAA